MILCSCQISGQNNLVKDGYDIICNTSDFSYSAPDLNRLKTVIKKELLPRATETEKKELNDFINTINKASVQKEAFFENAADFAMLVSGVAKTAILLNSYVPVDDLDAQLKIPSTLLMAGDTLKMLVASDSKEIHNLNYSEDIALFKEKSLEFAEKTLSRFPDEGRAYGQVGFVLVRTGRDKTKALQMYKRCIELDKDAGFCRDGYHTLKNKMKN
jgi:tetratricopeptide (TPR) repeat protein